MRKVLVSCPPMLRMLDNFLEFATARDIELCKVNTMQILPEEKLFELVPQFDGWIIGDDPATARVFEEGKRGRLRAAVKWGVGVDNVDLESCAELGIPVTNTPNMFGGEVADLAIGYMVGLARETFYIDREIREKGNWPKPTGRSISGKRIGVVGFGDIGQNTVRRLAGFDVGVTVYDPWVSGNMGYSFVDRRTFPEDIHQLDFLILTCSLNKNNFHMLNEEILAMTKPEVMIINVSRGSLIHESALIDALSNGQVSAAALDVFEEEPLPKDSPLRKMPKCILGSHNGSNTVEGVNRASKEAIRKMAELLDATL